MIRLWKALRLAGAALCFFGLVGCGGGGSSGPSTSVGNSVLTGGGQGGTNGGLGGNGNYVEFYNDFSTGGNIVVKSAGHADASFAPATPTPDYGSNPLFLDANTTILQELTTEPPAGTPYLASDNALYVSDGDAILGPADPDQLPITGLRIAATATITFGTTGTANLTIDLGNDFVNYGTVTSANQTAADRGNLRFDTGSFLNFGTIALGATAPGQNGGSLDAYAYAVAGSGGAVLNHGIIQSYGGDATNANGGAGGSIYLYGDSFCENTSTINSYGGAASGNAGSGGNGGSVTLETLEGNTRNSGVINTFGGAGIAGGGSGGDFQIYIDTVGDCLNGGTLNTYGGGTGTGIGGSGGYVNYDIWQGGIRHNADIHARGGSAGTATGDGGPGGSVSINTWAGTGPVPTPVKETQISGNIDLRGGDALANGSGNGGSGGYFTTSIAGDNLPLGQELILLGYQNIDTRGGSGNYGGDGGDIYGWQNYAFDSSQEYPPGGFLLDGITITTRGGDALAAAGAKPAAGGDGGYVWFEMDTTSAATVPITAPSSFHFVGSIDSSGGDNLEQTQSTGAAGFVLVYARSGINLQGNITARGGNDLGITSGFGGAGSYVSLMTDSGDIVVSGNIDMSGGSGALHGGDAGTTTDPVAATGQGVVTVGAVSADGGNAKSTLPGSIGGNAGDFSLLAPAGSSVSHGILSAKGGTGATPGSDGVITIVP